MRELAFVYLYMDIKLLLYTEAFKKTWNLLFIELIEYYNFLFHREIRGRSVFSPKTTKRKSIEARNALLIKKSGMARAVMTPRARSRSWACECLAPPRIWMQKESSQISFSSSYTDVHNQEPRLPREYRDSDSPILHTFRGISPSWGETKFAEPFLRLRGSYGLLSAATLIFMGERFTRKRCAQTDTGEEGERKKRKKETPARVTRNYVTFM